MSQPNINPTSKLGLALAEWNKPWRYEEFPEMVYKASLDGGRVVCEGPKSWRLVNSPQERQEAFEMGWHPDPQKAIASLRARQESEFEQAAHLEYEDRNLSDAAKAEKAQRVAAADTAGQVLDIPEAPKRKRGRPRKTVAA